ncbi:hypothetical protein VPNG_06216 [Cytospora leucostoma]|uniref:J domain-containing protein n=1 Tax=Cytospora leucostoma TaxID=1230097 RepID=A0A423WYK4_9PEZI|nr:hypothetical protein VPNG_06216 [Cytospora leucostoma]
MQTAQNVYAYVSETAYETLGVSETASQHEITRAFRWLSLQFHPDKASDTREANAKMAFINTFHHENHLCGGLEVGQITSLDVSNIASRLAVFSLPFTFSLSA